MQKKSRTNNRLKIRKCVYKWVENNREYLNEKESIKRHNCHDSYIKDLLRSQTGLTNSEIDALPLDIITPKRKEIQLKRKLKETNINQ